MNLIDAIIFVSAPYEYESILAARYVGGVGIGLITVPFLIHSAEIASSTNRGTCCALEQYGLALGVAIQVIYDSQWSQGLGMTINRVHGIFGIVFTAIALGTFSAGRQTEAALVAHSRRLKLEGAPSHTYV